jgi:bacterioferritin
VPQLGLRASRRAHPRRVDRRDERLNRGIARCVEKGDNGTRELLAEILTAEEEHIDWLETQQETIRQIGYERYLAQQLHD